MALTVISENTTMTDGTEQTLVTDTTGGVYVFKLDTAAMINGDELEVRIKNVTRSAGTERLLYYAVYKNAQAQPAKASPPCPEDVSIEVTIKRTAGGDRTYPNKLLKL